jgi:hypothetical protein
MCTGIAAVENRQLWRNDSPMLRRASIEAGWQWRYGVPKISQQRRAASW